VVDNSSTDGTEELIRSLKAHAPCFFEYLRKPDEGPGVARNLAIAKARGSVIAFTDDDCVADSVWLEKGVAKLVDGIGLVQGKTLPNPHQSVKTFSRTQDIVKENGLYQTCNMFYRRDLLDLVGGFSADFIGLDRFGIPRMGGDDTDLAWRVKKLGWKSIFADDAVVYHHVFPLRPWKIILSYLMYQAYLYILPYLIKKHPELRKVTLYRQFFLTRVRALFYLFFLSVVIGIAINEVFFLLTIPYIAVRFKGIFNGLPLNRYHLGLVAFAFFLLHDVVASILLTCGSIRYRSIVL